MIRKIEVRNWYEDPTAWGFTRNDIEVAIELQKAGITPYQLREHLHDFEWVANIVKRENDKMLERAFDDAIRSFKHETTQ